MTRIPNFRRCSDVYASRASCRGSEEYDVSRKCKGVLFRKRAKICVSTTYAVLRFPLRHTTTLVALTAGAAFHFDLESSVYG